MKVKHTQMRKPKKIKLGGSNITKLMRLDGSSKKNARVQKSHHFTHRFNLMVSAARRYNGTPSYRKLYPDQNPYMAAVGESIRAEQGMHRTWGSVLGSDARLHGTDGAYDYTPAKPKKEPTDGEAKLEAAMNKLFG